MIDTANPIEVDMCDVCYLLDDDQRLKPGAYCLSCDAFICEWCQPNKFRRFRAMFKRKLRRLFFTTSLLLILFSLCHAQTPPPASQFEVYCSAGSSPLPPNGWTLNPSTGKYRAWLCVDLNGHVSIIASGGASPGAPVNSLQGNKAGAFGGIPGSHADFVNGPITLAPTVGVPLSVTGDLAGNDIFDWFINGGGVGATLDTGGTFSPVGYSSQDTGFSYFGGAVTIGNFTGLAGDLAITNGVNTNHIIGSVTGNASSYFLPSKPAGSYTLATTLDAALTQIATTTLGVAGNSITFSSIPATFTNLRIVLSGASADTDGAVYIQFNGDTATDYNQAFTFGGTAVGNGTQAATATPTIALVAESTSPANATGSNEIIVYNYHQTSFLKNATSLSFRVDSGGGLVLFQEGVIWSNAAGLAAINSIKLAKTSGGNFVAGTIATLYGML